MTPTLGCYVSAFRLLTNGFDYERSLRAALAFFDYVTVAVNTRDDDGTLAALQSLADQIDISPRLKVVSVDLSYDDVTFDGRLKDAALQACEGDVLCQMDLDESVGPSQRALWRQYATKLLDSPGVECFMLPSVDLWGSKDTIRADKAIDLKFRMHRKGLHRGVWKRAWLVPGKLFRTDMSDSGEILTADRELAASVAVVPPQFLQPTTHAMLNGYPWTAHWGYADLDQRVRVNKAIWAQHWTDRNGGRDAKVAVDKAALQTYPLIKHHLNLS